MQEAVRTSSLKRWYANEGIQWNHIHNILGTVSVSVLRIQYNRGEGVVGWGFKTSLSWSVREGIRVLLQAASSKIFF